MRADMLDSSGVRQSQHIRLALASASSLRRMSETPRHKDYWAGYAEALSWVLGGERQGLGAWLRHHDRSQDRGSS
jgi:hypothetical protein